MKIYQQPAIISQTFEYINAIGQYIFEFTPGACPGLTTGNFSYEGQEGGVKACFQGPPALPGNFDAEITCENISGTFNVHFGSGTDIGNDCFFMPITSIFPELPANCVVDGFFVDGQFDDCNPPA